MLALILSLIVGLTPPTPSATPAPTPTPLSVPWSVDCADDIKENGYLFEGYCVPGMVTYETARFSHPQYFSGAMSSYADGIMERVAGNRGMGLGGFKGGAALMGCGDIGMSAYVRVPGGDWYGPLLVVDCSGRSGLYEYILVRRLAIEVDYQTAKRLGGLTLPWVDVRVEGNVGGVPGMSLATWFERNVLTFDYPANLPFSTPTAAPSATVTPSPEPTGVRRALASADQVIVGPREIARSDTVLDFAEVLFWLLVGHALADFVFQTDKMRQFKRPVRVQEGGAPWWFWMSAHCLVHAGAVALATGRIEIGMLEFVVHFAADSIPRRNAYLNQGLHVISKLVWAYMVVSL